MRSLLAGARSFGRRHLSKVLFAAAVLGVPAAVVIGTGGTESVVFWTVTVVWLAASFYAALIGGFFLLLLLSPVVFRLENRVPERFDTIGGAVGRGFIVIVVLGLYLTKADLDGAGDIRLPTPWPNVGAVVVLVVAALAAYGLIRLARRFRLPAKPAHRRRHRVAEPDDEYWSDQPVVAWRAWSWDGATLKGVHNRWLSDEYVASCPTCDRAPSWAHECGIYALKDPRGAQGLGGVSAAVGKVEMWGDVIEHEYGYRASHARITDLWVGDQWRADRIQAAYPGVRVSVGSPIRTEEVV